MNRRFSSSSKTKLKKELMSHSKRVPRLFYLQTSCLLLVWKVYKLNWYLIQLLHFQYPQTYWSREGTCILRSEFNVISLGCSCITLSMLMRVAWVGLVVISRGLELIIMKMMADIIIDYIITTFQEGSTLALCLDQCFWKQQHNQFYRFS